MWLYIRFRQSLKMVKDSTEKNEEVSEIERKRRQSLEVAFSAKVCWRDVAVVVTSYNDDCV